MRQAEEPTKETSEVVHVRRFGGLKWHLRPVTITPELQRILNNPEGFIQESKEVLKDDRKRTVVAGEDFVLKRFGRRSPVDLVTHQFRRSHASQAWRMTTAFERARIPTIRAVAFCNRWRAGIFLNSYLVMERIPGAVSLAELKEGHRRVVIELATIIASMHNAGLSHRDLKPGNIVLDEARQIRLLDLDDAKKTASISRRRVIKDLSRLANQTVMRGRFSRVHALRFLKQYCQWRGLGEWRGIWRSIEVHAARL